MTSHSDLDIDRQNAERKTTMTDTARADHDTLDEINDCRMMLADGFLREKRSLTRLWNYAQANGPRGPVDGWSTLTW